MNHNNHTVLLVEDDADDVLMVRDALAKKPFIKLVNEKNGFEALMYLKELQAIAAPLPCLIIMDINMPVLNGKQLLPILKKEEDFSIIPVVIFTTSSQKIDDEYCKQFNVRMVTKPSDIETFTKTILALMDDCKAA